MLACISLISFRINRLFRLWPPKHFNVAVCLFPWTEGNQSSHFQASVAIPVGLQRETGTTAPPRLPLHQHPWQNTRVSFHFNSCFDAQKLWVPHAGVLIYLNRFRCVCATTTPCVKNSMLMWSRSCISQYVCLCAWVHKHLCISFFFRQSLVNK